MNFLPLRYLTQSFFVCPHRDFNARITREGTRTRQEISPLAAPRPVRDTENALNDSYNPHRIKGANLTGSALRSALASKISPCTPQETYNYARVNFRHALRLRAEFNKRHDHSCLSLDRRGVIYAIFTTTGPFECYVGQTVHSSLDRFSSHIQEATTYHADSVYASSEGRGLYLYMQNHGLKNLAVLCFATASHARSFRCSYCNHDES